MTDTDRDRLLQAALNHVPFDGMNERALLAGARDIGLSPALARVHFPQGGAGLAAAYHRRADAALREWLEQTPPEGRFRDRVAEAVWHRLTLVDPELVRARGGGAGAATECRAGGPAGLGNRRYHLGRAGRYFRGCQLVFETCNPVGGHQCDRAVLAGRQFRKPSGYARFH